MQKKELNTHQISLTQSLTQGGERKMDPPEHKIILVQFIQGKFAILAYILQRKQHTQNKINVFLK